jgi:uncharacterized membrane protein YecN with MAPEG domain
MDLLPVTATLAGLFALVAVVLSVAVSLRRRQLHVALGDGGDETLKRRIRAFGNFAEYAPFAVILVWLVEYQQGTTAFVRVLGGAMLASRLFHAWGMLYASTSAPRALGMTVQHLAFLAAGIWLLRGLLQQ